MHACLAVTCHLHFWQNGWDILRATEITRGWNGYRNRSQHRKLTLEKKTLPVHFALRPQKRGGLLGTWTGGGGGGGDERVKARPRIPPEKDRRDRGPPSEQWKCTAQLRFQLPSPLPSVTSDTVAVALLLRNCRAKRQKSLSQPTSMSIAHDLL